MIKGSFRGSNDCIKEEDEKDEEGKKRTVAAMPDLIESHMATCLPVSPSVRAAGWLAGCSSKSSLVQLD